MIIRLCLRQKVQTAGAAAVIDVRTETLVPLSELPSHLPHRNGRKVSVATVYRWSLAGVRGVRLETLQCAGAKVCSLEAVQRFFDELTRLRDGRPEAPPAPAPRKAKARRGDVSKRLDEIGV
jgi:hypothetical protein